MSDQNTAPAKTVVLGVTGSIAAYKAGDLTSQLVKLGNCVNVVMTTEAQEFITPLTLQTLSRQPVITRLAEEENGWQPGHIQLADDADLLLIAPARKKAVSMDEISQSHCRSPVRGSTKW